jgi:hypothetical protein
VWGGGGCHGNETADQLAGMGCPHPFTGPEPAVGEWQVGVSGTALAGNTGCIGGPLQDKNMQRVFK